MVYWALAFSSADTATRRPSERFLLTRQWKGLFLQLDPHALLA
jgi:hypothetical protein